MKRLFVLFAFLLVSCAVFAQDEKPQSEGTLLIVPRIEAEPLYSFGERAWSVDMGTTSFYTFFDGNLGDHFSFSFGNHWFTYCDSFENVKDLYRNTWRTDVNNWVDWAYVTVNFSGFFLQLGKDYIHFGTHEVDTYDHDSHWQLNSALWNNYQVYQWGGRFGWTDDDETTKIMLEVVNDQPRDGEPRKPFSSRSVDDYAFNIFGTHDFDNVTLMASVGQCSLNWIGGFGVGVNFSDAFSLAFDGYASKTYGGASLKMTVSPTERFDLFAKAGFDKGNNDLILEGKRFYAGAGAYWFPLRESHDLRVHALAAYDSFNVGLDEPVPTLGFSVGLTYALNLQIF